MWRQTRSPPNKQMQADHAELCIQNCASTTHKTQRTSFEPETTTKHPPPPPPPNLSMNNHPYSRQPQSGQMLRSNKLQTLRVWNHKWESYIFQSSLRELLPVPSDAILPRVWARFFTAMIFFCSSLQWKRGTDQSKTKAIQKGNWRENKRKSSCKHAGTIYRVHAVNSNVCYANSNHTNAENSSDTANITSPSNNKSVTHTHTHTHLASQSELPHAQLLQQ